MDFLSGLDKEVLALERSEKAREFNDAGRAGGVVVGAGMNLPDLRRRERIGITIAQMIIVRADDDVFVRLAGHIGEHVIHGGMDRVDMDGHA